MVDRTIAAAKVAAIRDAVDRIRRTLPPDPRVFEADRTAREIGDLLDFCEVVGRAVGTD